ncbi:uncharacterized protein LOC128209104 [Mya arenaria]|uniref:uncharacterized protein LOC128209104 n=1 Tax=Mya arenaria TaxID=6604 RepID=UPI0022E8BD71|nr:uncharacterized protein LOC128209104 [Mya arenaria]
MASDEMHDFSCSVCKDDNLYTEAKYFCGNCFKYFCDKCLTLHAKDRKEHIVLGHKDVDKWVGQGDALLTCDLHPSKVLELLCEDHAELCCSLCVSLKHRLCRSISLIADLANGIHKMADFKQLPAKVTKVLASLNKVGEARKKNQNSLKASGKSILTKIKDLRKKLNQLLDEIEKKTVEAMASVLADLNGSIQKDIDQCDHLHDKLTALLDKIQARGEDSESSSYIGYRKCQDKIAEVNSLFKQMSTRPEATITFQSDKHAEQLLSELKTLGYIQGYPSTQFLNKPTGVPSPREIKKSSEISKTFKVEGTKTFSIKLYTDKKPCSITGVTELPGGEIVLVDNDNCEVKVLNNMYKVIAHCDLPKYPWDICQISNNKVAVAVSFEYLRYEVHFLTVSTDTIKMTSKFSVKHYCRSIRHHQDQLYVSSGNAMYLYTTAGRLVKKIHEDTSWQYTVRSFALSTDGTKIYIVDHIRNAIVTIDNTGNTPATLQDTDIDWPCYAQVSECGHVFVCSFDSDTVLQIDPEGNKKLATLVREKDGIQGPRVGWYSTRTSRLIVGGNQDHILVAKLQ